MKRDGVSFTTNQHGVTSKQTVETKYIFVNISAHTSKLLKERTDT